MKFIFIMPLLATIISSNIFAQTSKDTVKNIDTHKHYRNEIGVAISPAYFIKEKAMSLSMHIHGIPKTNFGVGVSYERIFLAPKHSTFGLVFAYRPIEQWSLTLSPGLTFEDEDPNAFFALHIETANEFEIGRFHVGPAFEFAYDPNDYHVSLGIHVGYGF